MSDVKQGGCVGFYCWLVSVIRIVECAISLNTKRFQNALQVAESSLIK